MIEWIHNDKGVAARYGYGATMVISSRRIEKVCFIVLFAPTMVFFWGWLKPIIGVPLISIALAGLLPLLGAKTWDDTVHEVPAVRCAVIFLLCALWLFLAGTGGIGYQNSDHEKHNAVLYDLVEKSHPVIYPEQKHLGTPPDSPLVYYIGYYLPAALAGKMAHSYKLSQWVLFAQLFLATLLVLTWIVVHFRLNRFHWAGLLLFILFSGADIWAHLLASKSMPPLGMHLEWLRFTPMQYSAVTTQLFWVPQHATAAWLGTIVLLSALRDVDPSRGFATVCILLLWSPFVAIGCLPFCLLFMERERFAALFHRKAEAVRMLSVMLCFLCLAIVLSLFLQCRSEAVTASRALITWGDYFWTVFLEFGWWAPFLSLTFVLLGSLEKQVLIVALATLVVIPLVKAPGINDFIMRASMPALFALFLAVLSAIRSLRINSRPRVAMVAATAIILVSSWITPLYEMARSLEHHEIGVPSFEGGDRVALLKPDWAARQYLGDPKGLFFRYLAREKEERQKEGR